METGLTTPQNIRRLNRISGVHHLEEIKAAGLAKPAVNQIELHPFCQQKGIVEYCAKESIVIQAYTPLIQGAFEHPVLASIANEVRQLPYLLQ